MTRPPIPIPIRDSLEPAMGYRRRGLLPLRSALAFGLAVVAVLAIAFFSYRSMVDRAKAADRVSYTLSLLEQLEGLFSTLKDAETGQRGYLLTGEDRYLEPYAAARAALPVQFTALQGLVASEPRQRERLSTIAQTAAEKLAELEQTIALRRGGDMAGALEIVRTDRGKNAMDRARLILGEMQADEQRELSLRERESERAAQFSVWVTWGGSALLLVLIATSAVVGSRDYRRAQAESWVRASHAGLAERIQGEARLEVLADRVLAFLARCLDAQAGALYIAETGDDHGDAISYRRIGAFAASPGDAHARLRPGDGLLGQAAREGRALHVRSVPKGYLTVSSALGRADAGELLIAPAVADGAVQAVIELGFLRALDPAELLLADRVAGLLGVAVRSARDRSRLEVLLDETQTQAEELQAQQEELRVSNEELEEQARAMTESQGRLQLQHVELEQTNAQLEEQATLLENRKDELAEAHLALGGRAEELERVSKYKSEFLANMSHELRTPLNSTLILAKLLADNRPGNLNPEQVRFAQTILGAGNDLLALVNDILDLSKIEAGKIDVTFETVELAPLLEGVVMPFRTVAGQKGLRLDMVIEPGAPSRLQTDPQRLAQILNNLLSNACKFTERGEVALRLSAAADGAAAFAVRDTGIGVAPEHRSTIFEAFQQADGSTHRKFGGTGLGLSISRDLARLLGGVIAVQSTPGAGSVFTLTLPAEPPPSPVLGAEPYRAPAPRIASGRVSLPSRPPAPPRPEPGDRTVAEGAEQARRNGRVILVIEDDVRFAEILRDLVQEMGFACILTHTAADGLAAASGADRPSAVLLDMNLPDRSGLEVLDRLKRDPATRHLPVHCVSVADHAREALELGAIGYALKPVQREQLVEALQRLEAKFMPGLRKVLVVEDDARQRDSIRELLGNDGVDITSVESAGDALEALGRTTFDCMVMDLNLPDLSGYELLEKMSAQEQVSFPPVIVYTGRSLDRNEEQRLRRYSSSIIIKDARSPERLLDEVTLFLHQVEDRLPAESRQLLKRARDRDAALDGRTVLVVEDDVRNIFALSSVLEPKGAKIEIARNGREALEQLDAATQRGVCAIDLVLMDIMMPEMDGFTAMREIRKRADWKKLPIIALTAKAMKDDQAKCLAAGADDYIAKPLDVERLLSLLRVWIRA